MRKNADIRFNTQNIAFYNDAHYNIANRGNVYAKDDGDDVKTAAAASAYLSVNSLLNFREKENRMKIRYSSPIVFTSDSTKIIAQMEAVGFNVTHKKENAGGTNVTFISMKDDNDHPMMIAESTRFTTPFSGIRLNVDDFEEALVKFTAMGYINLQTGATDTGTSHATLLRSPEGIFVSIGEHTVG